MATFVLSKKLVHSTRIESVRGVHARAARENVTAAKMPSKPTTPKTAPSANHQAIRLTYPEAPAAEVYRFAAARKTPKDALKLYGNYLRWRQGNGSAERLQNAARAVPANFATLGGWTSRGDQVVLVEGARYTKKIGVDAYVARVCCLLDETLEDNCDRRAVVLVDARPGCGEGWTNRPASEAMPFFRALAALIPDMYPERLRRIIIYPLPGWAAMLIKVVRSMLDPVTKAKIKVVKGDDGKDAPCPVGLCAYDLTQDQIPAHARRRHRKLPADPTSPKPRGTPRRRPSLDGSPAVWVPNDAEVDDSAVLLSSPTKRPFVVRMESGEVAEVPRVRPRDMGTPEC